MAKAARAVATAVTVLGLLTACSTSGATSTASSVAFASSAAPQAEVPAASPLGPPPKFHIPRDILSPLPEVGTGGQLIPIQSDNVAQAGYDAATGTMTVLFDSGGLYEYYDVPAVLWEIFVAAQPHSWSAVGDPHLVKDGYRYARIG